MTDKQIELMFIECLEGKVNLTIDSFPTKKDVNHEIGVMMLTNENYVTFHFNGKDDLILFVSQYFNKDDYLLEKERIKRLKNQFEEENSPFDFISTCDEHNGLNLYGGIHKGEINPEFLEKVIQYLSNPTPFLEDLMSIRKEMVWKN